MMAVFPFTPIELPLNFVKLFQSQQVVLDSAFSNPVSVHSGVPQGTVLGLLMFHLYINNITKHVKSLLRLLILLTIAKCTEPSKHIKMLLSFRSTT